MKIDKYEFVKKYYPDKVDKILEILDAILRPYSEPIEIFKLRWEWINFRYEYDYLRRYRDGSCEKERRIYQVLCKEVGRYKKETGTCEQIFKISEGEFRYKP